MSLNIQLLILPLSVHATSIMMQIVVSVCNAILEQLAT